MGQTDGHLPRADPIPYQSGGPPVGFLQVRTSLRRYGQRAIMSGTRVVQPLFWVGSARKDLRALPEPVKDVVGHALFIAQLGRKHEDAKPLRGFRGAGVLEIIEDFAGDTYRAVYTVRFADAIYVLHVFQKKSKRGTKTPQKDLDLIRERLKRAEQDHASWTKTGR